MEAPPEGWVVWSDDDGLVLAFRPDVFDSRAFPPACLPTIYVARGRRNRRPGVTRQPPPDAAWSVTLILEPEVERTHGGFDSRGAAIRRARELARAFSSGTVDYRALYQVTADREAYLARLDALTGRSG